MNKFKNIRINWNYQQNIDKLSSNKSALAREMISNYQNLTDTNKELLIKAIINAERESFSSMPQFKIIDEIFHQFKISFQFSDKGKGDFYDPKLQLISIEKGENENKYIGFIMYETIMHELFHAFQDCLIKNQNLLLSESEEYKYVELLRLNRDENKAEINFCNLNGIGDLHIRTNIELDKATMFYVISPIESTAYEYAQNKLKNLQNDLENNDISYNQISASEYFWNDILKEEIEKCIRIYNIKGITVREFLNITDTAFAVLHFGESKLEEIKNLTEKDITATIAYDIACLAMVQIGTLTKEDYDEKQKLRQFNLALNNYADCTNPESRYGPYVAIENKYLNGMRKSDDLQKAIDLLEFQEMSKEDQEHYPYTVLGIIRLHGERAKEYIKSPDALREFCLQNPIAVNTMEITSIIENMYGKDFLKAEVINSTAERLETVEENKSINEMFREYLGDFVKDVEEQGIKIADEDEIAAGKASKAIAKSENEGSMRDD